MNYYNIISHEFLDDNHRIIMSGTPSQLRHITYVHNDNIAMVDASYDEEYFTDISAWIDALLRGDNPARPLFDIPTTTPFKAACLHAMLNVPSGETITYSELAANAGNEKAVRAAASACATNPLPLLIPCHRIVNKQRGLSGFAWGTAFKKRLLALESDIGQPSQLTG